FQCQLADINPNTASIKCQINSTWTAAEKPLAKVDGDAQYTFDRAQGMMTTGYCECKLQLSTNGIETTVPFQIAFRLNDALTPDQMKQHDDAVRQASEEKSAKIRGDMEAADAKRVADSNSKLEKDIAALRSTSAKQDVVIMALSDLSMLGHDDKFVQQVPK